jgi:2-amino-4-hydroxy-6-hydroxymethyldihydropteridine diphosphokinase
MAIAYIGIGSNLNAPVDQVRQAILELERIPNTCNVVCSPLYLSAPLGPTDQPDYINAVAGIETSLSPNALLNALQDIEQRHGRVRNVRWGPRTLDLDLLLYDDLRQNDSALILPHPRMHERIFVLQPLRDIAPELAIPGLGKIEQLLRNCPPLDIRRLEPN